MNYNTESFYLVFFSLTRKEIGVLFALISGWIYYTNGKYREEKMRLTSDKNRQQMLH